MSTEADNGSGFANNVWAQMAVLVVVVAALVVLAAEYMW